MALTEKQRLFVSEYLVDLNATQAAIRAGYSSKSAREQACRMLTNVDIEKLIAEKSRARQEKLELSADRVLTELMQVAFANVGDYFHEDGGAFDLKKLTRAQKAAIEITVEKSMEGGKPSKKIRYRLADKTRALELLGKRLKLWTDRQEVALADWETFSEKLASARKRVNGAA